MGNSELHEPKAGTGHAFETQVSFQLGEIQAGLADTRKDLEVLFSKVDDVNEKLSGNGQTGLCTRLDRVEQWIKRVGDRHSERRQGVDRFVVSVITAVVVLAVQWVVGKMKV